MDTCLSAATDKDVRRFDWFCNLLAILSRPAVTLAFLRMGDALTLAQAALSASALVLGVLLAYADVICSKLCRDRRAAGALNKLASANLLLFPNICKVPVWLVAYVCIVDGPILWRDACRGRLDVFDLWLQHKGLRGTLYFEVT